MSQFPLGSLKEVIHNSFTELEGPDGEGDVGQSGHTTGPIALQSKTGIVQ